MHIISDVEDCDGTQLNNTKPKKSRLHLSSSSNLSENPPEESIIEKSVWP